MNFDSNQKIDIHTYLSMDMCTHLKLLLRLPNTSSIEKNGTLMITAVSPHIKALRCDFYLQEDAAEILNCLMLSLQALTTFQNKMLLTKGSISLIFKLI